MLREQRLAGKALRGGTASDIGPLEVTTSMMPPPPHDAPEVAASFGRGTAEIRLNAPSRMGWQGLLATEFQLRSPLRSDSYDRILTPDATFF